MSIFFFFILAVSTPSAEAFGTVRASDSTWIVRPVFSDVAVPLRAPRLRRTRGGGVIEDDLYYKNNRWFSPIPLNGDYRYYDRDYFVRDEFGRLIRRDATGGNVRRIGLPSDYPALLLEEILLDPHSDLNRLREFSLQELYGSSLIDFDRLQELGLDLRDLHGNPLYDLNRLRELGVIVGGGQGFGIDGFGSFDGLRMTPDSVRVVDATSGGRGGPSGSGVGQNGAGPGGFGTRGGVRVTDGTQRGGGNGQNGGANGGDSSGGNAGNNGNSGVLDSAKQRLEQLLNDPNSDLNKMREFLLSDILGSPSIDFDKLRELGLDLPSLLNDSSYDLNRLRDLGVIPKKLRDGIDAVQDAISNLLDDANANLNRLRGFSLSDLLKSPRIDFGKLRDLGFDFPTIFADPNFDLNRLRDLGVILPRGSLSGIGTGGIGTPRFGRGNTGGSNGNTNGSRTWRFSGRRDDSRTGGGSGDRGCSAEDDGENLDGNIFGPYFDTYYCNIFGPIPTFDELLGPRASEQ